MLVLDSATGKESGLMSELLWGLAWVQQMDKESVQSLELESAMRLASV